MSNIDNSKLKKLMKDFSKGMNDNIQKKFFNELSKSSLFIPVDLTHDGVDLNLNNPKDELSNVIQIPFHPFLLKQEDGKTLLPLFTDEYECDKFGSYMVLPIGPLEIATLLIENKDIYGVIINPNNVDSIGISTRLFLDFVSSTTIPVFSNFVAKNSKPLKYESRFYLREEVPLMKQMAKNGIFTSKLPFNASFKDNFDENCKYLNILIIPKGVRFLYIGQIDGFRDSIFPPIIKFKLIEENENTFIWKCISQDFKPVGKNNIKRIYLIAIILIAVIIFILMQVLILF